MKFLVKIFLFALFSFSQSLHAIESSNGFLVTAYDERFRVISPEKYKASMEVVIENKTLTRLIGKLVINGKTVAGYSSIESDQYQKFHVNLKKGDILHFIPLSPAFQEVELIVGNKTYEIPPKK
jgi:hypothetical protein